MSGNQRDSESWAELFRLREEVKGPERFATWKDAAVAERVKLTELKEKLAGSEAEIAALKQGLHRADEKLAEHMPLAKFGAMVLGNRLLMFQPSSVTSHALKAGVLISDGSIIQAAAYAPNIEATITKLLKGNQ
jgi:hypothetical protein